jgi:hypothetical protein
MRDFKRLKTQCFQKFKQTSMLFTKKTFLFTHAFTEMLGGFLELFSYKQEQI